MFVKRLSVLCFVGIVAPLVSTTLITDIQGIAYRSSYLGQTLTNITGIVTAKQSSGFFLLGEPSKDVRASNGIFVFSSSVVKTVEIGDSLSLSGTIAEYRSTPGYLYLTEISSPTDVTVLSSGNSPTPLILGKDRSPPTQQLSSLDTGSDGWLSVPNNASLVSVTNSTLQPDLYGMDFWESLDGQLVTIPSPVALNFENQYGEFWVRGNWTATGLNGRGGLTLTMGDDGIPDANPEVIMIGDPLDGTKSPITAVGVALEDITGVVKYQYGFYYVLPLTAPIVVSRPDTVVPPTVVTSDSLNSCSLVFADYNVENLTPTSGHLPNIADHIANYLLLPDLIFVQEIQDNSGATDDGTVDANITLFTLVASIEEISGFTYDFVEIAPEDGQDGGQPGGNIRVAYLYNPEKLTLVPGVAGGSLDRANVKRSHKKAALSYNPGRVDPTNEVWTATRKPLAAEWETACGAKLFTVNVHMSSKGGSSSSQGDYRPPVNSPVVTRTGQVGVVAAFVKSILDIDAAANIVVSGDFNEYGQTRSVFASITESLHEIDEVAGVDPVERYTYVYDQNTQHLDHIFISPSLAKRGAEIQHVHVNNWSPSYDERISDHDPSVGKVWLC